MFKKLVTLAFVFMLAFHPVASISAETLSDGEKNKAEDTDRADSKADEEESKDEDSNPEEADEEQTLEDEASETDDNEKAEEEGEDNTNSEEKEATEVTESESDKEDTEAAESDEEGEVNADADEEDNISEEDEVEAQATDDEDLNLDDIYGIATGDINFDLAKGHYVLDLKAGLQTIADQDIEDKWVAFALPNGVDAVGELPSGVIGIIIKGKSGLAVKVPNVKGIGEESIAKEIALRGEVDDNDPIENLYMVNVDSEANLYEEIGEVSGQREIDFSKMETNPSIDLTGTVEGGTEFDDENAFYYLNLTVNAENNAYDNIDDLYVAFELPEDVLVLNTDDTPEGYEQLSVDGKKMGAVKLPNVGEDGKGTETYRIPIIGKSNAVVTDDSIQLYTMEESGYNHVGNANGSISVDYSGMDESWYFDVKSEVITDYPSVSGNQTGFRFNYTTKNLTLDDVDKVTMEFVVPNDITIEKPQYINGGAKIDWDGNTATVDLGNLSGGSGYEGYFTAVGETSKSLKQLKDLDVKVTLYRDGEKEVISVKSPFVEGKYDENDFDNPPPPNNDGDDDEEKPDDNNGENDDKPGNSDNDNTDDTDNTGNNNDGSNDNGAAGTDEDDSDGDVTVEVEDGEDSVTDSDASVESQASDGELPNTATNMYTMLAIGLVMLVAGGVIMFVRRRVAS